MPDQVEIYSAYSLLGMLFIWCEQDFFPGGEREAGTIDLRVQRDTITNIPICRASSLKGPIRAFFEQYSNKLDIEVDVIFGNQNRASAVEFLRAGIILYPVHSFIGLFGYVTSPYQLREYWLNHLRNRGDQKARDLISILDTLEMKLKNKKAIITDNSIFRDMDLVLAKGEFIIQKDEVEQDKNFNTLLQTLIEQAIPKTGKNIFSGYHYTKEKVEKATILVPDELFRKIIDRTLPRITRIALDYETKTVKRGALFIQEFIPRHTLLASGVYEAERCRDISEVSNQIKKFVNILKTNPLINIGGNETVGYGMVRLVFYS